MTDSDIEREIERMVNEVLVDFFEIEPFRLRKEAHIFDDLGLDSLDIVDLVAALQMKFEVRIRSTEAIRDIRTLGDIYAFVISLKQELGTPPGSSRG